MPAHESINYFEFPAADMQATRDFFGAVFNWQFVDYGSEYTAVCGAGLDGGFYKSDKQSTTASGACLMVFYSEDLEQTQAKIEQANGSIIKAIFSFPGGRRFHFTDPNGNEFAVWSEKGVAE